MEGIESIKRITSDYPGMISIHLYSLPSALILILCLFMNDCRSSRINEETVIGAGTEVGENTTIAHSVIGRNCQIGKILIKI